MSNDRITSRSPVAGSLPLAADMFSQSWVRIGIVAVCLLVVTPFICRSNSKPDGKPEAKPPVRFDRVSPSTELRKLVPAPFPDPTTPQAWNEDSSSTVYITRTGTRYHRGGCQYLRQSSIPVSLEEAVRRGEIPCKRCNPPILVERARLK
jgi:hypothetical protein